MTKQEWIDEYAGLLNKFYKSTEIAKTLAEETYADYGIETYIIDNTDNPEKSPKETFKLITNDW